MSVVDCAADPDLGVDFVDVSGVRIEHIAKGSGQPLLLLHGFDGVEATADLIDALAQDFAVLAPSHPGFGASDLPATFSTPDDIAYLYLDWIKQRQLDNLVIVGLSFGGWIAAEMLIKSSAHVAAAILAAPLGLRTGNRRTVPATDLFMLGEADQAACLGLPQGPAPIDLPIDRLSRLVRNRDATSLFAWNPYLYDPKLAQRLYRIDVPTLVLWGDEDRLLGADQGRAFADAIPGAGFEMLPGGHRLYADQAQALAARVTRFAKEGDR